MTPVRRPPHPRDTPVSDRAIPRAGVATGASLGIRVRLVPAGSDRKSELVALVLSCETLRAEWERLLPRVIDVLSDEAQSKDDGSSPSSHSCRK